jgi:hypothetical protein
MPSKSNYRISQYKIAKKIGLKVKEEPIAISERGIQVKRLGEEPVRIFINGNDFW